MPSARRAETPTLTDQEVGSVLLTQLHAYWSSKRGVRVAPRRCDIDPIEIPALLPHLLLVDVVEGGARFRYRLAGTEIETRIGRRMTNRHVDELTSGRYGVYIHSLYRELLTTGSPVYSENVYGQFEETPYFTQRLMLPLSNDGEVIDMVLCGQIVSHSPTAKPKTLFELQQDFSEVSSGG